MRALLLLLVLLPLVLGACRAGLPGTSGSATGADCGAAGQGFDTGVEDGVEPPIVEWVDPPPVDVAGLVARSELVVVGRVASTADATRYPGEEPPLGAELELATVEVERTLVGEAPARLDVRQVVSGMLPALAADQRYVLFLRQFEWREGEPTGEWSVTFAPLGLYGLAGDCVVVLSDAYRVPLPAGTTLAELEAEIAAAPAAPG